MRKLIYIYAILLLSISSLWAQSDSTSQWSRANKFYMDGDYTASILLYEEMLGSHQHSAMVYYNLGNAYYKNGNIGKAILNYNRALQLEPSDEDIQHNLMLAQAKTIDKIEPVPQFFIKRWLMELGGVFGSDTWAMMALVFFGVTLGGVTLWLISSTLGLRKLGFYSAFIALVITVASFVYSEINYTKQTSTAEAIVMNSAAPVKSAPSATSKDLFLIHEGTKVTVLQSLDEWNEVVLEDGNKGWILKSAIERINS